MKTFMRRKYGIIVGLSAVLSLISISCLRPTSASIRGGLAVNCATKPKVGESKKASLNLLAGPFYDPDVKALVNNATTGCAKAGCHDGSQSPRLTNYTEVKAAKTRFIARMNNAGSPMPPSGLWPQDQRATIQSWFNADAPEKDTAAPNSPTPTPTPAGAASGTTTNKTSSVTFNGQVKSMLQAKCGGSKCHDASGAIPLEIGDYAAVKGQVEGFSDRMKRAATASGAMPPKSDRRDFKDSDLKLFNDWVEGGMVEGESSSADSSETVDECADPSKSMSDEQKAAVDALLNPPDLKKCAAEKQVYDYKKKECIDETVLESKCDEKWVKDAIAKAEATKKSKIEGLLADGWKPHQCAVAGETDNLFYLVKIDSSVSPPTMEKTGYKIPKP